MVSTLVKPLTLGELKEIRRTMHATSDNGLRHNLQRLLDTAELAVQERDRAVATVKLKLRESTEALQKTRGQVKELRASNLELRKELQETKGSLRLLHDSIYPVVAKDNVKAGSENNGFDAITRTG